MHIMYVDESGDPEAYTGFNSPHFILSGIILSQDDWLPVLQKLKGFKQYCKQQYNLPISTEIHASELIRINKMDAYRPIRKTQRIYILRDFMQQLPIIFSTCKVINICFDKTQHANTYTDFQEVVWSRLIQRYDTYLKRNAKDLGMIFSDDTNEPLLRGLLRKMRVYNPVPYAGNMGYQQIPTDNIIEDIVMRPSDKSYFIQAVDAISHCLYRKEYPKGSLKKFRVEHFFNNIQPILLTKAAAYDKDGIVRK